MKLIYVLFLIAIIQSNVNAEDLGFNENLLFEGVTKQSADYSCGSAALSTLITGLVEGSNVNENDIMSNVNSGLSIGKGYTLFDLANISQKLGYHAEWRKVSTSEIKKINIPVMLLIGLNDEFPHFVVLKGIRDNIAYLADSIRGNVRVNYDDLVKQGISDKYKKWFVMAIEPSEKRPISTTLYLPNDEKVRFRTHATIEQSSAITLLTLAKNEQFIVNYNLSFLQRDKASSGVIINSDIYTNSLSVQYGISEETELGGGLNYSDNYNELTLNGATVASENHDVRYNLFVNNRLKFDSLGGFHFKWGGIVSYAENNSVFGGGVSSIGYKNTKFGQINFGSSFGKSYSKDSEIDGFLPKYSYSVFLGANIPLGDRYLGAVDFAINDAKEKHSSLVFDKSYSISTSLTYVLNKEFQLAPSIEYEFGGGESLSVGLRITRIGRW